MASLNKCQFIGNAGANPEARTFDNGNKIATLRLAVTERYTDRNGQQQEYTEWVPLVFNNKLADIASQYITKGSPVYVEGKWRTRKWTDQQGVERFQTEMRVDTLQLLGPRPQQQAPAQAPHAQAQQAAPAPQYNAYPQYQQAPAQVQKPQYAPAPAPRPSVEQQAVVDPNTDLPF